MLIPHRLRGILALLLVTCIWGTTFPAMKDLSADLSAVWIALLRFALAGLLLAPFLWRARRGDLLAGALLGATLFASFMLQTEGLALTSSNRNAFITGLNVLVVPLLGVLAGKLPPRHIVLAVALALGGLTALCWDGGAWSYGDTLALGGAVCYGIYVKQTEMATRRASHLMALTAMQVITVGVCAALWLLLWELPRHPLDWTLLQQALHQHAPNLLYLGIVATAAIIALQAWGQRHTSANEAAVTYAFEPACAAIAAYFWIGETMGWGGAIGGVLLIAGIIASQWSSSAAETEMPVTVPAAS
ncbi:DMT family transporter [Herminiimonas sp. CN]|uniref:DMT family transporter n=1 Tax=Herminiimonas sp. CN TaxID=1349818 RepID=UPI000686BB16|nr:DMT family transporter [Herminiimonas sp. CN]